MDPSKLEVELVPPLAKKIARQVLKDYVLFPLLSGPMAVPVLAGNAVANIIRNYWTWAVIYCGHFPDGTVVFTEEQIRNETRGQWYLRQMMGSANIEGSHALHILTGHLSHQIEHHLLPTIPAWRYPEMAVEVQAIAKKYGVPYTSGPFGKQLRSVFKRILRLSLPLSVDDALNWRENAVINARMKAEGHEVLKGKRKAGYHAPRAVKREEGASETAKRVVKALRRSSSWLGRLAA